MKFFLLTILFTLAPMLTFAQTSNVAVTAPFGMLQRYDATIANGATSSEAMDLRGLALVGVQFPATFTGTTVTFTMSDSFAGTYVPVYNSAGAISYTIAQARYYAIDPKDFHGIRFLKIVSGSAEGGARTVKLSFKSLN